MKKVVLKPISDPTATSEVDYEDHIEVLCHNVSFWYTGNDEMTEERKILLTEEAERRATECIKDGYLSGELNYESEDYNARGWWKIEKE